MNTRIQKVVIKLLTTLLATLTVAFPFVLINPCFFLNHNQGNNRQKYYLALGAGVFLFATMHVWHSIRTGTIKRHAQIIERQKVF